VVLEGTGRKAILEGYTSAGKTGTAQKVDPATGAYSKTKYIGSFAGFAPLNDPQIVVAVILDSAVGPHQGGQVAAPVFRRVAQQTLEYLHTPHDLPLAPQHQLLLAQARMKDKDLEEGTPDHPGELLETAQVSGDSGATRAPASSTPIADGQVVQAAMRENAASEAPAKTNSVLGQSAKATAPPDTRAQGETQPSGTVVLDISQGGVEVPSFSGKTLRSAVETAQEAGLELEAVGSGVARQQSPLAGTHVAAGAHVTVQFGR